MKNFVRNFILSGTQSVKMKFPTEGDYRDFSRRESEVQTKLHRKILKDKKSEVSEVLKAHEE